MKILLNLIKYIIVILLTFCIIGLLIINIASSTILKKQYVLNKLEETNYYEEIQKLIQDGFENYIGPSGLDESVIVDIVSLEKIKEDTNTIVSNMYDGTNTELNTETLRTNLRNNIDEYLNHRKLTTSENESIEKFIDMIEEEYIINILHTNYENDIYKVINKGNNFAENVNLVLILVTVASILLILIFNVKQIAQAIANFGVAFTASGLFYIVIKIYIGIKINVQNLSVLSPAFSQAMISVVQNVLNSILTYSIILFILGVVCICIGNSIIIKNEMKKRSKKKEY